MGYLEEKQRIIDYVTKDGMIIELTRDKDNVKINYKELERYADLKLAIRYPGYKTTQTKCDYCVYLVDATRSGGPPAPNWSDVGNLYDVVAGIRYQ